MLILLTKIMPDVKKQLSQLPSVEIIIDSKEIYYCEIKAYITEQQQELTNSELCKMISEEKIPTLTLIKTYNCGSMFVLEEPSEILDKIK